MFIVSTISTVLIMFILFYMKRRLQNLEGTVKDQAKITQNILGMINTMTATTGTIHNAGTNTLASKFKNECLETESTINKHNVLAEMMGCEPSSGLKTSIFCTKLSEPNVSKDQNFFESSAFPYMSEMSASISGMILVSDMEDNDKPDDEESEKRFQEIHDDRNDCCSGNGKDDDDNNGNCDADADADDGIESISTEILPSLTDGVPVANHPYEHMKVSELRSLAEDRSIFISKGKLKKEIIHLLEEHDRETHGKSSNETASTATRTEAETTEPAAH